MDQRQGYPGGDFRNQVLQPGSATGPGRASVQVGSFPGGGSPMRASPLPPTNLNAGGQVSTRPNEAPATAAATPPSPAYTVIKEAEATVRQDAVEEEATEDVFAALRAELKEETAIAARMHASVEAREANLREFQQARSQTSVPAAGSASAGGSRRPPTPPTPSLPPGLAEAQQVRTMAKQLEQRAWRAQNAVKASEAHEDLLKAHRTDLERRLEEAEMALQQLGGKIPKAKFLRDSEEGDRDRSRADHIRGPVVDGVPEDSIRLQGAVEEAKQLPKLEAWEAGLAERVRQGAEKEAQVQEAAVRLQNRVLDLSSECGMLWLGSSADDYRSREEAELTRVLQDVAFEGSLFTPLSLDDVLDRLEEDSTEVQAELEFRHRLTAAERLEHDHVDFLASELADIQAEVAAYSERSALAEAEASDAHLELGDSDDRVAEALTLRRENEVLRRQQQEWQRSQLRMLRLIEDMQRQRARGVQSQALVAQRLSELQRSLGGSARGYPTSRSNSPYQSPPRSNAGSRQLSPARRGSPERESRRMDAIRNDNVALQSQIRKLELEKEDLIKGQQDLISLVKSKMPQLEEAMLRQR